MTPDELSKLHFSLSVRNAKRPLLCPEPIDLGNGLVLRRGEPSDNDQLVPFHKYFPAVARDTQDTFNQQEDSLHPTLDCSCYTVIVDTTKNGKIVSSLMSVPQIWFYGSPDPLTAPDRLLDNMVPLIVTRQESVATDEAYRGQDFVRLQLDVHAEWTKQLGGSIQFIGGMPQYYARFGYDCSPPRNVGVGGSKGSVAPTIAAYKKEKESDPSMPLLSFRRAVPADAPFLTRLTRANFSRRQEIWTDIPEPVWVNAIAGRQPAAYTAHDIFILEAKSESQCDAVGFVQLQSFFGAVTLFEVDDTVEIVSWSDATAALVEWLQLYEVEHRAAKTLFVRAPFGAPLPTDPPKPASLSDEWSFKLNLGSSHPCYTSITSPALPSTFKGDYWFTKIINMTEFIRKVTPVLSSRLKSSLTFVNLNATLALQLSVHSAAGASIISIKRGRVVDVREGNKGEIRSDLVKAGAKLVACNGTSWMRMLLGHRTASELEDNGDLCVLDRMAVQILDVLFPRGRVDNIVGLN